MYSLTCRIGYPGEDGEDLLQICQRSARRLLRMCQLVLGHSHIEGLHVVNKRRGGDAERSCFALGGGSHGVSV